MQELKKSNIEEYKILREEILHISNKRHQTITMLYSGVAAIIAFAVTVNEPLLYLIPFVVIIPTYSMVITQSNDIRKVGAYLRIFHESPDSEFMWETWVSKFNKCCEMKRWQNSFMLPFVLLSVLALALFAVRFDWKNIGSVSSVLTCVLAILCAGIIIFLRIHQRDIDNLGNDYACEWQKLKMSEDEKFENNTD